MPDLPKIFSPGGPADRIDLKAKAYGSAWKRLRARRLAADPLCVHCAAKGHVTAAEQVDHILPVALGGQDTWDNTQSLCRPCHKAKTKLDIARIHRGY